MEEKSCSLFFLLGSNPEISRGALNGLYEDLSSVFGEFLSFKINVGRLSSENFRVKIRIVRHIESRAIAEEEEYFGIIGDILHLPNGVKMKLACYYQDGTHESDYEWEPCLKITFFR